MKACRAPVFLLTTPAMPAFAANSVLSRLALKDTGIGAASFTAVRLASVAPASGVVMLFAMRPGHRAASAATMQPSMPVIAALSDIALRLTLAAVAILGGIASATLRRRQAA
jgi:hypothetical protein